MQAVKQLGCQGAGNRKETDREETAKKVEKTFEKPLDKREGMWYTIRALPHRLEKRREKNLKKF